MCYQTTQTRRFMSLVWIRLAHYQEIYNTWSSLGLKLYYSKSVMNHLVHLIDGMLTKGCSGTLTDLHQWVIIRNTEFRYPPRDHGRRNVSNVSLRRGIERHSKCGGIVLLENRSTDDERAFALFFKYRHKNWAIRLFLDTMRNAGRSKATFGKRKKH